MHPQVFPSCAPSFFLLPKLFFSFNDHPLLKASLTLSTFCCFLSVAMNILLSMLSLLHSLSHSLLGGPPNGFGISVYPSDCCWCMAIFFFFKLQMASQLKALHEQLFQPFQELPYIYLVLPMASVFSCHILLLDCEPIQGKELVGLTCIPCRMYMNACWVCMEG